ncbi:hypothetical protein JCM19239_2135 [Vibrio variabilis]|uniref:Uncharacterized protein n=1 Tax=Vibrio variabilis TaxID=990271 RepID=A0ABQ0JJG2_9VIBR|nr:hypothetical protein JCM19239_2135 [Vibrio variabilis]
MVGINEFYKSTIGTKLRTSQAWGCVSADYGVFLNVWVEEIKNGKAYIGCKKPVYNKGGALHMNDQERKTHIELIAQGVTAHAVLISNGLGMPSGKKATNGTSQTLMTYKYSK